MGGLRRTTKGLVERIERLTGLSSVAGGFWELVLG